MNKSFKTISYIEASITDKLTRNQLISKQQIVDELKLSETSIDIVINKLLSTNVIRLRPDNKYEYVKPLEDDVVILDGQLLLPVAIIDEGETIIVSRGSKWYRFDKGFDIRRIIWNVDIIENNGNDKNTTLVDLLKTSIIKESKTKNIQLDEYADLVGKVAPYNDDIGLHLKIIGEEITDINIMFKIHLFDKDHTISTQFRNFASPSTISTIELLTELNKETDYDFGNIRLDHEVEANDLIFVGNCLPIGFCEDNKGTKMLPVNSIKGSILKYAKITKIKKSFDFEICTIDYLSTTKMVDSYSYDSLSEGIEDLINLTKPFISLLFRKNDFLLTTDNQ